MQMKLSVLSQKHKDGAMERLAVLLRGKEEVEKEKKEEKEMERETCVECFCHAAKVT